MFSYSIYQTRTGQAPAVPYVAASGTSTYYSDSWRGETDWGLTVFTSGTLTGTWTLWATDKLNPDLANDNDWVDISTATEFVETNPAGSTSKYHISSVDIKAGYLRLRYVNASGTGNLTAYVTTCRD